MVVTSGIRDKYDIVRHSQKFGISSLDTVLQKQE